MLTYATNLGHHTKWDSRKVHFAGVRAMIDDNLHFWITEAGRGLASDAGLFCGPS
jgi:hypothetical protein